MSGARSRGELAFPREDVIHSQWGTHARLARPLTSRRGGGKRRTAAPDRFVLGTYLACAALIRFGIEFLRRREPLFGPFAVAHVLSLAVAVAGRVLLVQGRADQRATRFAEQDGGCTLTNRTVLTLD